MLSCKRLATRTAVIFGSCLSSDPSISKGFTGLSALVQNVLASNTFCGQVFVFRGRNA